MTVKITAAGAADTGGAGSLFGADFSCPRRTLPARSWTTSGLSRRKMGQHWILGGKSKEGEVEGLSRTLGGWSPDWRRAAPSVVGIVIRIYFRGASTAAEAAASAAAARRDRGANATVLGAFVRRARDGRTPPPPPRRRPLRALDQISSLLSNHVPVPISEYRNDSSLPLGLKSEDLCSITLQTIFQLRLHHHSAEKKFQ